MAFQSSEQVTMNGELLLDLLHLYFWAGIAWMAFCRCVMMGSGTRWIVTIAVSALGATATGMAIAPFVPAWGEHRSPLTIATGAALFLYLLAFGRNWSKGVPDGLLVNSGN